MRRDLVVQVIVDYGEDGVMWDGLSVSFSGTVPVEVSA